MGHAPDWMRQSFAKIKKLADGGQGLQDIESDEGLAPYGFRHAESVSDPFEAKGKGFLGHRSHKGGSTSTEISTYTRELGDHPMMVPTLTNSELQHLLDGNEPTEAIYKKADDHAAKRKAEGKSTFAQPNELRFPKE